MCGDTCAVQGAACAAIAHDGEGDKRALFSKLYLPLSHHRSSHTWKPPQAQPPHFLELQALCYSLNAFACRIASGKWYFLERKLYIFQGHLLCCIDLNLPACISLLLLRLLAALSLWCHVTRWGGNGCFDCAISPGGGWACSADGSAQANRVTRRGFEHWCCADWVYRNGAYRTTRCTHTKAMLWWSWVRQSQLLWHAGWADCACLSAQAKG